MSAVLDQKCSPPHGHCIKPRPVQERTFVNSVTDLVSNAMPNQASSTSTSFEKISWVSFEECDITDPSFKFLLEKVSGPDLPLIVVVGYTCGYQIWAVMSNGDCEELLSVRDIPVKLVKFLPQPKIPSFDVNVDKFAGNRPLMAVCDGASTGRQFCTVNFVSLQNGDSVRNYRFEDVIVNILCGKKATVVTFANKFVVLDSLTLSEQFWIKNCSTDMVANSVSLSAIWVAYPDCKINSTYQSCGGISVGDEHNSYANQVVSVAKNFGKTVSELGSSIATSFSGTRSTTTTSKHQKVGNENNSENQGVVTILHVEQFSKQMTDIHSANECNGVVSHFVAHADERVASMKFNCNGSLLLTCGTSGNQFHLFSILPHPSSSSLGAVQHLYTLQRGTTVAKVQNIAFSVDSRWVAISTYNGTTHLFPITPYGGPINVRTHASAMVVNRESRFYRSAGLENLELSTTTTGTQLLSSSPVAAAKSSGSKELHPSMNVQHLSLYRSASNPRLPPYPQSVVVSALAKIKQQHFGLSNLGVDFGGAGKKSNANSVVKKYENAKSATADVQKYMVSASFGNCRGWRTLNPTQKPDTYPYSLYIARTDGQLREYQLSVRPDPSTAGSRVSSDNPVEMQVLPMVDWTINRSKSDPEYFLPLPPDHLLLAATVTKRQPLTDMDDLIKQKENASNLWISQVEIVTYSGPHRRLWMGPQFTFKTYVESQRSAPLVSPDGRSRIDRSEPMEVPGRIRVNSVPVLIEASSTGSFEQAPDLVMEVCGSWSDNDYISCDDQEGRLRESIADAMVDKPSSPLGGPLNADAASCSGEDVSLSSVSSSRGGLSHSPSRDSQLQFGSDI